MANPAKSESPPQSSKVAAADRVPTKQKIAYGLGTVNDMWGSWLYPTMVWPVFNIFLHVSPTLVSLALMINRLVDAISDPFFGWLSDNTRTKYGRRRPYILVGSILAGLSLPMLFWVGRDWTEMQYFWYMVISSGVYITIVSCFNMPYQSLGNELTPDYHERTMLFSFKSGIQKIPELAMFFAAAFITLKIFNDASGEPDMLKGARTYSLMLGGLMIVVGFIIFFVVKERYYDKLVVKQTERTRLMETIWECLKVKPFRSQLAMALSYGLSTSMVGSLGYYMTVFYVCNGDIALGSRWNFIMGLSNMALGLGGIPIFAYIARRVGKRAAMFAVQISAMGVFLLSWFLYNPNAPWLQPFASGLIALTQAGFWMVYSSIGADVIDYDELESGKRREGAFAACGTWIMKLGLATGIGLSGVVLEITGFDASLGSAQDPAALTSIRFFFLAFPLGGLVIAMIGLWRFRLTPQRMAEIRVELEARRGVV
jgi:GPH family glycoside/pentoside/hexuronide:cation symporter